MIEVEWSELKSFIDERGVSPQYVELSRYFIIHTFDGSFALKCEIDKDPSDTTDLDDWNNNYKPNGNKRIEHNDPSGLPVVAMDKNSNDWDTYISPNFCDNTDTVRPWASANDSSWTLSPPSGKIWQLKKGEVQFTEDISLANHSIIMEYYVWHTVYSPGTPMVGKTVTISDMGVLYDLGNEFFVSCPRVDYNNKCMEMIKFDYPGKIKMYGSESDISKDGDVAYVKLYVQEQTPVVGQFATVGFVVDYLV